MSRSTRSATSPTARPASRATLSPKPRRKPAPKVTLVSGPVKVPDPRGVNIVKVEAARDMLAAVEAALPADVAVFAAAVADWRSASNSREKIKKTGKSPPELALVENPDILSTVAHRKTRRPKLVIGFAAETERVVEAPHDPAPCADFTGDGDQPSG